eukprot:m.276793 g.276793  ORF g.276793 m.276793 type:complete len:55 (-) comp126374_c0_seq1:120-284(-)
MANSSTLSHSIVCLSLPLTHSLPPPSIARNEERMIDTTNQNLHKLRCKKMPKQW